MKNSYNIVDLLEQGKTIQIKPKGYSMYPMFVPGRDFAILSKADVNKIRRGDVVLYRREGSILVLHRIWKIIDDNVYLVGDNQVAIEGPLRKNQIKAVLVAFVRKDKTISVKNPVYLMLSRGWLMLRPLRPFFHSIFSGICTLLRIQ